MKSRLTLKLKIGGRTHRIGRPSANEYGNQLKLIALAWLMRLLLVSVRERLVVASAGSDRIHPKARRPDAFYAALSTMTGDQLLLMQDDPQQDVSRLRAFAEELCALLYSYHCCNRHLRQVKSPARFGMFCPICDAILRLHEVSSDGKTALRGVPHEHILAG